MWHFPSLFVFFWQNLELLWCLCCTIVRLFTFALLPCFITLEIAKCLFFQRDGREVRKSIRVAYSRLCDRFPRLSSRHETEFVKFIALAVVAAVVAMLMTVMYLFGRLDMFSLAPDFKASFHVASSPPSLIAQRTSILPLDVVLGGTVNISFLITSSIGIESVLLIWNKPSGALSHSQSCKQLQLAPDSTPYNASYSTSCIVHHSWQQPGKQLIKIQARDYQFNTFESALGAVNLALFEPEPQPNTVITFSMPGSNGSNNSNQSPVASINSSACFSAGNTSIRALSCGLPSIPILTLASYGGTNCAAPPAEILSVPSGYFSSGVLSSCTAPLRLAALNDTLCNAGAGCHSAGDALAQCNRFSETAWTSLSMRQKQSLDSLYQCRCSASFTGPYCVSSIELQFADLTRNSTFRESLAMEFMMQDPNDPLNVGRIRCPDGSLRISFSTCDPFPPGFKAEILGEVQKIRSLAAIVRAAFNASHASNLTDSCEPCGGFKGSCPTACNPLTPHMCDRQCPLQLCYKCDSFRHLWWKMAIFQGLVEDEIIFHRHTLQPVSNNQSSIRIGEFVQQQSNDAGHWTTSYTVTYYLHCTLQFILYYLISPLIWFGYAQAAYEQVPASMARHISLHQNLRKCSHCMRDKLAPDDPCLVRCNGGHSIHRDCLDHLIKQEFGRVLQAPTARLHVPCPACSIRRHSLRPHFSPKQLRCDGGGVCGIARALVIRVEEWDRSGHDDLGGYLLPRSCMELIQRIESGDPDFSDVNVMGFFAQNEQFESALSWQPWQSREALLDRQGMAMLQRALSINTSITMLNLSDCRLGADAVGIMRSVAHLTGLTQLDFCNNRICSDDAARIYGIAAAAGMTSLRNIWFGLHDINRCERRRNTVSVVDVINSAAWGQLNLPLPSPLDLFLVVASENLLLRCALSQNREQFNASWRGDVDDLLSMDLLRCIELNDPTFTALTLPQSDPNVSFCSDKLSAPGSLILARALSLNTCITSLRLRLSYDAAAHAVDIARSVTQLTGLTELDIQTCGGYCNLNAQCSSDDDQCQIFCILALARMTSLQRLALPLEDRAVQLHRNRNIGYPQPFVPIVSEPECSSAVRDFLDSSMWNQTLRLPQPPSHFVHYISLLSHDNHYGRGVILGPLLQFALSEQRSEFTTSYHPILTPQLLQRIRDSDHTLTSLDLTDLRLPHATLLSEALANNSSITCLRLVFLHAGPEFECLKRFLDQNFFARFAHALPIMKQERARLRAEATLEMLSYRYILHKDHEMILESMGLQPAHTLLNLHVAVDHRSHLSATRDISCRIHPSLCFVGSSRSVSPDGHDRAAQHTTCTDSSSRSGGNTASALAVIHHPTSSERYSCRRAPQGPGFLSLELFSAKMRLSASCAALNSLRRSSTNSLLQSSLHPPPAVEVYRFCMNRSEHLRVLGCMQVSMLITRLLSSTHTGQPSHRRCHQAMLCVLVRVAARQASMAPELLHIRGMLLAREGKCAAAAADFSAGAAAGDTRCMAELSWMLCSGRQGVTKDADTAFDLASRGARQNCCDCIAALSKCLADGRGCDKNMERSMALAQESAAAGSRLGQYQLGQLHDKSKYNYWPADIAVAVRNYTLAAAQHLAPAQFSLGYLHEFGCPALPIDHAEAIRLYLAAAAQGHPYAYFRLARCYESGRGLPADRSNAIDMYMKAQAAGYDAEHVHAHLVRLGAAPPSNMSVVLNAARRAMRCTAFWLWAPFSFLAARWPLSRRRTRACATLVWVLIAHTFLELYVDRSSIQEFFLRLALPLLAVADALVYPHIIAAPSLLVRLLGCLLHPTQRQIKAVCVVLASVIIISYHPYFGHYFVNAAISRLISQVVAGLVTHKALRMLQ